LVVRVGWSCLEIRARVTQTESGRCDVTPSPISLGSAEQKGVAEMDTRPADANSELALHERLLIAALLVGVTLWIRVVEVIPERRRRS
jgi:hypothetical protein